MDQQFSFKINATDEFLCTADSALFAKVKASMFIEANGLCHEEFSWVPSVDGDRTFRMSIGA